MTKVESVSCGSCGYEDVYECPSCKKETMDVQHDDPEEFIIGNNEPAEDDGLNHFVSKSCSGETCSICDAPSTHKVGEHIFSDDPIPGRHNLTAYVCCEHFRLIFGAAVPCDTLRSKSKTQ
jgi:hypothetical protein